MSVRMISSEGTEFRKLRPEKAILKCDEKLRDTGHVGRNEEDTTLPDLQLLERKRKRKRERERERKRKRKRKTEGNEDEDEEDEGQEKDSEEFLSCSNQRHPLGAKEETNELKKQIKLNHTETGENNRGKLNEKENEENEEKEEKAEREREKAERVEKKGREEKAEREKEKEKEKEEPLKSNVTPSLPSRKSSSRVYCGKVFIHGWPLKDDKPLPVLEVYPRRGVTELRTISKFYLSTLN
jgi:hypothetical protein